MVGAGTILDIGPGAAGDEHRALEARGHRIVACTGPEGARRCPLLEGGACALVEAADGVVFRLDLDDDHHRALLRCYRREVGESSPLRVVARPGQSERYAELLDGLDVSAEGIGSVDGWSSRVAMAAAARQALADLSDAAGFGVRDLAGWT